VVVGDRLAVGLDDRHAAVVYSAASGLAPPGAAFLIARFCFGCFQPGLPAAVFLVDAMLSGHGQFLLFAVCRR
jgi:hypothetical protein